MTLQIVIGNLSLVWLELVGDGRLIIGSDPRVWPAIALVSSGFFDEKHDIFLIRYRVKGAQIVETTLPCSFAPFPLVASGACSSGRHSMLVRLRFCKGRVDLIGEVEIWQWQSWRSRFPLPFVIAPLTCRCICCCHWLTNQESDRSDHQTLWPVRSITRWWLAGKGLFPFELDVIGLNDRFRINPNPTYLWSTLHVMVSLSFFIF